MKLRIVSLNCWSEGQQNKLRWPLIVQQLAALKPDVVCLQEVFHRKKALELKKALKSSQLHYKTNCGGLAIISSSPKVKTGSIVLKTESAKEKESRFGYWVRLKIDRKEWDFFVTHLSWRPEDNEIRQKQILELNDWMGQINEGKRPCVLTGDMNAVPESGEMQFLSGDRWVYSSREGVAQTQKLQQPFKDTYVEANFKQNGRKTAQRKKDAYTWAYKNRYTLRVDLPERRIDYIWFRAPQQKSKYKIVSSQLCFNQPGDKGFYPSDHFGVVTDIR